MLCEAFDRLKYRRVEWKCDSLNERSRLVAMRLGFRFEGVFRPSIVTRLVIAIKANPTRAN